MAKFENLVDEEYKHGFVTDVDDQRNVRNESQWYYCSTTWHQHI